MKHTHNTSIVRSGDSGNLEEYIPPVATASIRDCGNMQGVTNPVAKPSVAALGEAESTGLSVASSRQLRRSTFTNKDAVVDSVFESHSTPRPMTNESFIREEYIRLWKQTLFDEYFVNTNDPQHPIRVKGKRA